MPSLVALLGLLAVAGYQNRGKLSEMLQNAGGNPDGQRRAGEPPQGGLLSELGNLFGGTSGAGTLSEGLGSLVERFRGAGQGDVADSWVGTGPNRPLSPGSLAQTLDDDTLAELEAKTGLGRAEILERLSRAIPEAVNRYTPQGRLPNGQEAADFV